MALPNPGFDEGFYGGGGGRGGFGGGMGGGLYGGGGGYGGGRGSGALGIARARMKRPGVARQPDPGTPLENFMENKDTPYINPNRDYPGMPQTLYTPDQAIMGLRGRGPLSMRGDRGALYGTEPGRERLGEISTAAMQMRGQSPFPQRNRGGQGMGVGMGGDYGDLIRRMLRQRGMALGG